MKSRKCYDLVIGLGTMCSCSQALRTASLQLLSMPFDWVGGPGLVFKAKMMRDGFAGWWDAEGWTKLPDPPHSMNPRWRDKWGFTPIHDFHNGISFEEELPIIRARYRKRVDRLNRLIGAASSVLILYVETPDFEKTAPGDADAARRALNERWPQIRFDFLILKYEEGRSFRERMDEQRDGQRIVTYDYRNYKEETWTADFVRIARWLKRDYCVPDYRTLEEKKAWKTKPRQDEYARYNVHNVFEYLLVKFQFKIFKHLRKRLERRGVVGV